MPLIATFLSVFSGMLKISTRSNRQAMDIKLDMKPNQKNALVDQERWKKIKDTFPQKVKKRLEGTDNYSSDGEDDVPLYYMNIAEEKKPVLIALCA